MMCSLSGVVPDEPVVCVKSGHVYEKRLIEKFIETTGTDPVTKEEVSLSDLIPLKSSTIPKPRPVAATSLPGLLGALQSEWDALMLETFQLRQTLDETRQELSQALYQHDAACRVIARLIKERDQSRAALSSAQAALASRQPATAAAAPGSDAGMAVDGSAAGSGSSAASDGSSSSSSSSSSGGGGAQGLTAEVSAAIGDKGKELSKARRKRAVTDTADTAQVASLALRRTFTHHSAATPGITALAVPPPASQRQHVLLTGGVDRSVLVLDAVAGVVTARIEGAVTRGAVTGVGWHPARDVLYSAGGDGAVRVWANVSAGGGGAYAGAGEYRAAHTLRPHARDVVALAVHPLGDLVLTVAREGAWALSDAAAGAVLSLVSSASADFTCGGLHPDGNLVVAGCGDGLVRVYDLREAKLAAELPGHGGGAAAPCSVCFSENGFHMATGGGPGGVVKVWDLRKVAALRTLVQGQPGLVAAQAEAWAGGPSPAVGALAFDFSGLYLASGAADGSVATWAVKEDFRGLAALLPPAAEGGGGAADITVLGWADRSATLYAAGMDRALRVWGAAPAAAGATA